MNMKKIKLLQVMTFCLILALCESCRYVDREVIPIETQTGAGIFGCYVNGELFVNEIGPLLDPSYHLSASYDLSTNILNILCTGKDRMGNINLTVLNPVVGITQMPLTAGLDKITVLSNEFTADNTIEKSMMIRYEMIENSGEIFLTKLDTTNHIVSGRFQFQVKGDSIISVTNGRFDAMLRVENGNE